LAIKLDPYGTYGTKLISLFAKLLFSQQSHSLTDLARTLRCSKQTILRLIDDIKRSYGVEIEELIKDRRKYYKLIKNGIKAPEIPLTAAELITLQMCKAFAAHLLGHEMLKTGDQAVEKSANGYLNTCSVTHFSSLNFGWIDYTPHQDTIQKLIYAMQEKRICEINYKSGYSDDVNTFFIKPFKIFAYKNTLYVCTQLARFPGRPLRRKSFDPLLALHRIKSISVTQRFFEYPIVFDFEKAFQSKFGIIKEDSFNAEIEFSGWAASYVAERVWCYGQKIVTKDNGKLLLKIKVSSTPEFISWVLSFGDLAVILKPKTYAKIILKSMESAVKKYNCKGNAIECS
jgi:predicted DNA-binding transcriptional regulator YafY